MQKVTPGMGQLWEDVRNACINKAERVCLGAGVVEGVHQAREMSFKLQACRCMPSSGSERPALHVFMPWVSVHCSTPSLCMSARLKSGATFAARITAFYGVRLRNGRFESLVNVLGL